MLCSLALRDLKTRAIYFGDKYKNLFDKHFVLEDFLTTDSYEDFFDWKLKLFKNTYQIKNGTKEENYHMKYEASSRISTIDGKNLHRYEYGNLSELEENIEKKRIARFNKISTLLGRNLTSSTLNSIFKMLDSSDNAFNEMVGNLEKLDDMVSRVLFLMLFEEKNLSVNKIKQISNTIGSHTRLIHSFLDLKTLDKMWEFNKVVRKLVKEHGTLIYGILEQTANLRTKNIDEVIEESLELMKHESEPLIAEKFEPFECFFEDKKYYVSNLVSPLSLQNEAEIMSHCVGGYSHSVKEGHSIIISFNTKNKEDRITVELMPFRSQKGAYVISQAMHYRNVRATKEEISFISNTLNPYFKLVNNVKKQDEQNLMEIPF